MTNENNMFTIGKQTAGRDIINPIIDNIDCINCGVHNLQSDKILDICKTHGINKGDSVEVFIRKVKS